MNLLSRLERLEADAGRASSYGALNIFTYCVSYGDDVRTKRAEAEAEFRGRNSDWTGPIEGRDGPICLIEIASIAADNGEPKHPEWVAYLDALKEPDRQENAHTIATYEAAA